MNQMIYINSHADVRVSHIAICKICWPSPAPRFEDMDERDIWIKKHKTDTKHEADATTEIRVITP